MLAIFLLCFQHLHADLGRACAQIVENTNLTRRLKRKRPSDELESLDGGDEEDVDEALEGLLKAAKIFLRYS